MYKHFSIFAATLSLIAMSCDNTVPGEVTTPEGTTVIYAGTMPESGPSRTAIDNTEYEGGHIGILWTPDDAIGVYGATGSNIRFGCIATAPTGRAPFTGNCDSPQYAYYPYSSANDGHPVTSLVGTLPAEQHYSLSSRKLEGDYKYGSPRLEAADEFDFRHIFALFRINVEATGTALAGETLAGVTLTLPEGRALAGDFTFDATAGTYAFTGNTTNSVTMRWSGMPALSEGRTVTGYMSAAPDLHADDEVTITVFTDSHKATFTRHIAYDFEADAVYTFNLTLNLYSDGLKVEELTPEPEEETANCYMITTAGEHDFKATVIGNGQKGIIPGAGFHTEDATIAPVSAALLWEDVDGFITDVELREGRVHYRTTGNTGNAVIAVYDGIGATGNILWSWHIWGTGDTLPATYDYTTKGGVVNRIMDRDLGAFPANDEQRLQTARVEADEDVVLRAMCYQWGRKDPMPNSLKRYVGGKEEDLTAFPVWKGASQAEHTIEASIQHPAELINRYEGNGDGDWLGTDVELLWGDAKFSGQDASGKWTNVKTIYDPSPVGYRVPSYYTFDSFIPLNKNESNMSGVSSYTTVDGVKIPALSQSFNCVIDTVYSGTVPRWLPKGMHMSRIGFACGSSSNSDKIFGYGIYMKRFENDTEGVYYPANGYLFPNVTTGNRKDYGKTSHRWLSCGAVTNTTGKGNVFLGHFVYLTGSGNYKEPDKGLGSGNSGVRGTVKTQETSYPWCAYPVRCVKE